MNWLIITIITITIANLVVSADVDATPSVDERFGPFTSPAKLEEVLRWKQVYFDGVQAPEGNDFIFPSRNQKPAQPQSNANFVPYNNVPMGVDHYKGRLFITVPRRRSGIPATLNTVDLAETTTNKSPRLKPFPDLLTNTLPTTPPDSSRIVSVYRTRIDPCDRLWFVDTGSLEYPDNIVQLQPPAIWIIDLKTSQTIRRFEIPQDITVQGYGIAAITVDVESNNCNAAFAYMADLVLGRLYVYSFRENRMWSFVHNYFFKSPLEGEFNVAGLTYQWDDNIFSITLGPKLPDGYRFVFFHPMVSTNEFSVSSKVLQDSSLANRTYHGNDFMLYGNRGPNTQSAMHQYDAKNNVMVYAEVGRNAIGCWNSRRPFNAANHVVIARDDQKMIYPSDMKVDSNGDLWVFSNSLPVYIYSQLNTNEFNFRVWKGNLANLIRNTICQ